MQTTLENRRIEFVKQLTYQEIENNRTRHKQKKIRKELDRIANRVALRISDYIQGEYYDSWYDPQDITLCPNELERYLNSTFKATFKVSVRKVELDTRYRIELVATE
jgi:hypothetical protein